tara:strand:- start:94 stop:2124 length:2031 start_codon:yes stop_codon:yes gene_type:complete
MRITHEGRVGIGGGATSKLQVNYTEGTLSSYDYSTTSTWYGKGLGIIGGSGGFIYGHDINHSIFFRKSPWGTADHNAYVNPGYHAFLTGALVGSNSLTEKMRIAANGNVGIGTSDPKQHLHVYGGSTATELYLGKESANDRSYIFKYFQGTATSGGNGILQIGHWGTHNTYNYYQGEWSFGGARTTTGNGVLSIVSKNDGNMDDAIICTPVVDTNHIINFLNTTGGLRGVIKGVNSSSISYVTTSDIRLKRNIRPMGSMLSRINALRPVRYTWIADDAEDEGFIAQEVYKVLPELRPVLTPTSLAEPMCTDERDYPRNKDGSDYMFGLDYGKFTPFLTKAIQELDEKVEQHRNRKSHLDGVDYSNVSDMYGLIVSATTNEFKNGKPTLTVSSHANDKSCYGVVIGVTPKSIDSETDVQRSGEGHVWVVNADGGILESGDLITTSNVPGYGVKQSDDILRSCTVSKITQDCDFAKHTKPKKVIKRELREVTYYTRDVFTRLEYIDRGDKTKMVPREEMVYENQDIKIHSTNDNYYTFREFQPEISENDYDTLTEEEKTSYRVSYMRYERIFEEQYSKLGDEDKQNYTPVVRTIYYNKQTRESKEKLPECCGEYTSELRREEVDVLDENGQIQWEDDPSGATEPVYEIRYLTADGKITDDESNAVHTAALVACTFHCG